MQEIFGRQGNGLSPKKKIKAMKIEIRIDGFGHSASDRYNEKG